MKPSDCSNPLPAGLVLLLAAAFGGCAASGPAVVGGYTAPTDPSSMNSYELHLADRWHCYRFTYEQERIDVYPEKSRVARINNPFDEGWTCQGLVDYQMVSFMGNINGEPIPESGLRGEGIIGADIRNENNQFLISSFLNEGPAASSGALKEGDRILAVADTPKDELIPTSQLTLHQLVWRIRGEPGTDVKLVVLGDGDYQTRQVTLTRARFSDEQVARLQSQQQARKRQTAKDEVANLVINGNTGQYMSPYTSDGVTAEWVNKAINANMGATTGSALGGAAGAYAADRALNSVPFAGMFGGMLGASAGKSVGRDAAIEASGGWAYIRATSDQSFRSLPEMARYLKAVYGNEPTFAETVAATVQIYPELAEVFTAR